MALSKEEKLFLKKFGLRVRQLREERGWTLEETEDHGWPSWRHLQRIESGHKNITMTTLKRISTLFAVKIEHLLSLDK